MIGIWFYRLALMYLAAGGFFAMPFLFRGIGRIDPGARGAHPAFRLMILPGVIALWPLLAARWVRAAQAGPRQ